MIRWSSALFLGAALVSLAACGTTPGCRAASTGALGAGTGALIAAAAGGPIGWAALAGGAAGAVAGAATPPQAASLGASPFCN